MYLHLQMVDSCIIMQYRELSCNRIMLTTSRRDALLERLARDRQLMVSPLAQEFGVSEDTLRRDLRDLAAEGRLVRVHGGAVAASPTHQPIAARQDMHAQEKVRLARAAARLIRDDGIVIIDGGTSHREIASALPLERRCTIVTHSPIVAASFESHDRIEIVLIGGRIFRHSMVAAGPEAAEAFSRINADLCLLGVTGIHPTLGLTTGDSNEAALKRIIMKAGSETTVLATPDKIGRASAWKISDLSQLATLITVHDRPEWLPPSVDHISA